MCKKNIKKLFLVLFIFIISGCKAEYNLNISDNKIIESSNFYTEENDLDFDNLDEDGPSSLEDIYNNYYKQDYRAFDYEINNESLYKKKKLNDYGMNLSYTYDFENFGNSLLFNYEISDGDNSYVNNEKYISIKISDFNCFYGEEEDAISHNLTINITTDLKVLENNADRVNGNVYSWDINRDNYYDKGLYIKIKKNIDFSNVTIFLSFVIVSIVVIIIFVFYIRKKFLINNDI